jgi:hypothetical protein
MADRLVSSLPRRHPHLRLVVGSIDDPIGGIHDNVAGPIPINPHLNLQSELVAGAAEDDGGVAHRHATTRHLRLNPPGASAFSRFIPSVRRGLARQAAVAQQNGRAPAILRQLHR